MKIRTRLIAVTTIMALLMVVLFFVTTWTMSKEIIYHHRVINKVYPLIEHTFHFERNIGNLRRLEIQFLHPVPPYLEKRLKKEMGFYIDDTENTISQISSITIDENVKDDMLKGLFRWWKGYRERHIQLFSLIDSGRMKEARALSERMGREIDAGIMPITHRLIHSLREELKHTLDEENEVDKTIEITLYLSVLLIVVIGLVVNLSTLRALTSGIKRLKKGADAIGEGRLSYRIGRIGEERGDELGDLMQSFDLMAQRLENYNIEIREKEKKLSTLYSIIASLTSSYDMDVAFTIALNRIRSVFSIPAGCIYLLDKDMKRIHLAQHVGLKERYIEELGRIDLKRKDICSVRAVLDRETVGAVEKAKDKAICKDSNRLTGLDCFIAIPILFRERVIGVLTLFAPLKRVLKRDEKELLESIVAEMGSAIGNFLLMQDVFNAKKEWEETFDAVADMIYIVDRDDRIVRANSAFSDRIGLDVEDVIGKRIDEVFTPPKVGYPFLPEEDTLKTGRPATKEMEVSVLKGFFSKETFPLFDDKGDMWGTVNIMRDITREKQLEAQLIQSEKLVAIGELVSGVAHELNNPLTTVLGYADLILMKGGVPKSIVENLEKIRDEGERASKIVKNLLSFARQKKPEKGTANANAIIDKCLQLRAYSLRVNNIVVVKELSGELPDTMLDTDQMTQVFLNIINNAEQAMHKAHGRGTLIIKTHTCTPEDGVSCDVCNREGKPAIIVEFIDDGPGIPDEIRNRIFDPFFTTKEPGEGTGLGLSVSYGIVAEHGGRIHATNNTFGGASFVIELPIHEEAPVLRQDTGEIRKEREGDTPAKG